MIHHNGGADLHATLTISHMEAMTGTTRTLRTPMGRHVEVLIPSGAYDGQVIRLENVDGASTGPGHALVMRIFVKSEADIATVISVGRIEHGSRGSSPCLPPIAPVTPVSPSLPEQPRFLSRGMLVLLIILSMLIIISGSGIIFTAHNSYVTRAASDAKVSALTLLESTATAQTINATVAAHANPYSPGGGTLVLDDPLTDNSRGYGWSVVMDVDDCLFTAGSYVVQESTPGYFAACPASIPDASNFAFQANMTFQSGSFGGLLFRWNPTSNNGYYFALENTGYYILAIYTAANTNGKTLVRGSVPTSSLLGSQGPNLLAVVVHGSTIDLYINHQQVASVEDASLTHGVVGMACTNSSQQNTPHRIAFNDAKVWKL